MNFVGDKFDKNNERRYDRVWICQQIRKDLKDTFGKDWKFLVHKDGYNSIEVIVKIHPPIEDEDLITGKIRRIADAYNYDDSDGQSDYFDRNFYLHVSIL